MTFLHEIALQSEKLTVITSPYVDSIAKKYLSDPHSLVSLVSLPAIMMLSRPCLQTYV